MRGINEERGTVPGLIDPTALSYDRVAQIYEASRPDYPLGAVNELVDRLSIAPSSVVADVGAGTGKFTRLLVPTGAFIIAVEPIAAMRRQLARSVPGVDIVGAAAGALPFADASLDAITVAQAFHWFANDQTVSEFRRVLRTGGGLGLVWNRRDLSSPIWRAIEELIAPHRPPRDTGWRGPLVDAGFTPLEESSFHRTYTVDPDRVVAHVSSMSWIAGLDADARSDLLAGVERIAQRHGSDGHVTMHEATEVYWMHRE